MQISNISEHHSKAVAGRPANTGTKLNQVNKRQPALGQFWSQIRGVKLSRKNGAVMEILGGRPWGGSIQPVHDSYQYTIASV